jgi:hypothetical protein
MYCSCSHLFGGGGGEEFCVCVCVDTQRLIIQIVCIIMLLSALHVIIIHYSHFTQSDTLCL